MIWFAAAVAGSFLAGALSRQPEINRLKDEVHRLQDHIEELQNIIDEQNQTITKLKYEYKALRATNFFEKKRVLEKTKGAILFQYCYKEFIDLSILQARNKNLDEQELAFYNIFDQMMHGKEVARAHKGAIKIYISEKYSYEIKKLIPIDSEALVNEIGGVDVA
jgi:outer membrane murein-binding lipoprotein Lpp